MNKLASLDVRKAKEIFEKICECEIKSISLSKGVMLYDNEEYRMVYLRVELEEGGEIVFEIYEESMTVISNMDIAETYTAAQDLMKYFIQEKL